MFARIICIGIVAKYGVHTVYLIKITVLTYTSYKEHCELYTGIHGSIAVNSCQIKFAQKDIILLWSVSVIFYKATTTRNNVEKNIFIKFSLSVGTYSTDDFNAKTKVVVLQERQDRVISSYHPLTFDHTHVDQWFAAFEVHPDMPYRRGYPNQK